MPAVIEGGGWDGGRTGHRKQSLLTQCNSTKAQTKGGTEDGVRTSIAADDGTGGRPKI